MDEKEPIVHIDHRPRKNSQRKKVVDIFDLNEIPQKLKMARHTIKALDDTMRTMLHVPDEWRNVWFKIDYKEQPVPILFDEEGRPYIVAPARKKLDHEITVMLREPYAEEILEMLEWSTDFCDYCNKPLNTKGGANQWLCYSDGGGAIADVLNCEFCERENIRWDKDFLDWHPILKSALER